MAYGNMKGLKYKSKSLDDKLMTPRQREMQKGRIKRNQHLNKGAKKK